MNRIWALLFFAVPVLAIAVYLASAFGWSPLEGTWFPQRLSVQAGQLDHLYLTIHLVAAVVLAVTGTVLFVALFRSTGHDPARYVHGNRLLEVTWTLIPAVILVLLALYQSGAWWASKIEQPSGQAPVAKVVARQFDWEFFYPGPDGQLDTGDDLRSVNELVVPRTDHVLLRLHSIDVIHSFFVPKLRLKQDIVPGNDITVWFSPTAAGDLEIICAEFCGWGHYNMRAKMRIVEPAEFEAWKRGLSSGDRPADQRAND